MKFNLEYFMSKWETDIKANIQTYITASNTDHSDTLLDDFVSDAFTSYDLPVEEPPYAVFYTLYPNASLVVDENGHSSAALEYTFNFDISVKENADNNMYRIGHRYLPMMTKLFNDIILKGTSSAFLTGADIVVIRKKDTGSRLLVSGITWQLSIPE